MDYNSLIHAIPKKWKKLDAFGLNFFISNPVDDLYLLSTNNKKIKYSFMKCKDFTLMFLDQISENPVAKTKWN